MSTLGIPAVLEIALVSTAGRVLYSDLSKIAMSRISPFYDSIVHMGQGDNLSLALDSSRTIIASRVTNRAILIVLTDKKAGIVLTKVKSVEDKLGRLLDELITMEESKTEPGQPSKEVAAGPTPIPPATVALIGEVQPPAPPPRQSPEAPKGIVETPTSIAKEVEETKETKVAEEKEGAGVVVSLNPWTILEAATKPKTEAIMLDDEMIKLLRSVDGFKSVEELAKESDVRLERALKKLSYLTQEGVLKLKYDEPVYETRPRVVGKLDAETSVVAIGARLGKIRSLKDVLKQIDGKKTVLAIARELEVDPEKMRKMLENLQKRGIIEL
nr:hypothetical protein [Candidatus Njordarchaeota archaeon]